MCNVDCDDTRDFVSEGLDRNLKSIQLEITSGDAHRSELTGLPFEISFRKSTGGLFAV